MDDTRSEKEIVSALIGRLSDDLGASISLGETGACMLEFENDVSIAVEIPEGSRILHVHAEIERCPSEDRSSFVEEALSLNLYGIETGGAALALDRGSDMLVLCLSQPIELLDEYHLLAIVDGFVSLVPELRDRLRAAAAGSGHRRSGDVPGGPGVIVA